jgi:deoxyhypusine synthase
MWPLVTWLIDRGYVDLVVSTSANVTEDLLEQRGIRFLQVDPDHVDDEALWRRRLYRFYDHVVSADAYDALEDFTGGFFEHLAATWKHPSIAGVRFTHELGRWLQAAGLEASIAATCARHGVPLFVPAAPDGPLAEGYRTATRKGPVVDFFKDYEIALGLMERSMRPGRGTSAIFLGGGVPKDFIQITATSVCAIRGNGSASPHLAAIQVTTDNPVFGGLGGAGVGEHLVGQGGAGRPERDGARRRHHRAAAPVPGAARALRRSTRAPGAGGDRRRPDWLGGSGRPPTRPIARDTPAEPRRPSGLRPPTRWRPA